VTDLQQPHDQADYAYLVVVHAVGTPHKHYVRKLTDDNVLGWGIQYASEKESLKSKYLHDCLHIDDLGQKNPQGRWRLSILRSEYQSDDLHFLERLMAEWISEEGFTMPEALRHISIDQGGEA
jgi:hypothetical protein